MNTSHILSKKCNMMRKLNGYCLILSLLLFTYFITPDLADAQQITLEDIFKNYKYIPKGIQGLESMNDGEHYTVLENNRVIAKHSYQTGEKVGEILDLNNYEDTEISIYDYQFSPDEKKLLLVTDKEQIYRHSFVAEYYVFDFETDSLERLSEGGKQKLATFSPDGEKIGFVRSNNIFIKYLNNNNEVQITRDGKWNHIINGEPDWVYEEEFAFSRGFFWSPESDKMAYYKFDESHVKQFNMTYYHKLYPEWYKYKYPKAGEENAHVSVHVYDLDSKNTTEMNVGEVLDQYIPRIKWTGAHGKLCIYRLNRLQNKLELLLADAHTGEHEIIYTESSETYMSEVTDNHARFIDNGSKFILTSEKSGYNHLYLYSANGDLITQLTDGMWDVISFIDYDPEKKMIYYSSHEDSPLEKQIYGISRELDFKQRLSREKGFNGIHFSKGFKYYIISNSQANMPNKYTCYNEMGEKMKVLVDNQELIEKMNKNRFPEKEFIKVPTEKNMALNGYIIKPADFDPGKQYPLLIYTYGGPESQKVIDSWSTMYFPWFAMLTQKGYVVACVDNRGTDGRGEAFRKSTYLQLGKLETIDQLNAAKYLGEKAFIDENRIGIFGWSYGGYLTSLCMTKGNGIFKTGVAVAPLTNWKYYDTIYTERFLRTPQENKEGYEDNSPINFADSLQGNLLLIHGSADDNVHPQNTFEFAKALIDANKQFDMQIYPNKAHSISGGVTRFHLFTKITDYLLENL